MGFAFSLKPRKYQLVSVRLLYLGLDFPNYNFVFYLALITEMIESWFFKEEQCKGGILKHN